MYHGIQNARSRKGFTLIELILVVALVALIGSVAGLLYSNIYLRNAASNAQDELVFSLRKAQMYSMMGRQGSNWGVAIGGNIVLYSGNSYASRNTAFDESYAVPNTVAIIGANEINFARLTGYPNVTSTITIASPGRTYTVQIQPQGIVSQN
jgi:prepilin-type N-terminal cleavage/methylation domain-containing protein